MIVLYRVVLIPILFIYCSLLHTDSIKLLWNIVWCLVLLASDVEMSQDIRTMGGIPLLLSMLQSVVSLHRNNLIDSLPPLNYFQIVSWCRLLGQ